MKRKNLKSTGCGGVVVSIPTRDNEIFIYIYIFIFGLMPMPVHACNACPPELGER